MKDVLDLLKNYLHSDYMDSEKQPKEKKLKKPKKSKKSKKQKEPPPVLLIEQGEYILSFK